MKTVVIVGDLVADQFLHGSIARVSREAPVFILRHETTTTLPGAAANAAANVASLGGRTVLIGLTGDDANGKALLSVLQQRNVNCDGVLTGDDLSTTTKTRVLAGHHYAVRQQVIRIDYENETPLTDRLKQQLRANFTTAAQAADAIIISDYDYGAVFPELFADALAVSAERNIPVVVDSRFRLGQYANATTATPNREEVEQILGKNFTPDDCAALNERLGFEALLVTNGNKGVSLFQKDLKPVEINAVGPSEPVDVTGAGDTVIAAYALGLASGLSFKDSAAIANHAGGIVVMKKGTATVSSGELIDSILHNEVSS
ncbi:MAG: bifunctional heptose 7-phosphate kinase/heptose 1-phosphate adenyltransferase [Pyrinomonadaceae bacterium]